MYTPIISASEYENTTGIQLSHMTKLGFHDPFQVAQDDKSGLIVLLGYRMEGPYKFVVERVLTTGQAIQERILKPNGKFRPYED